MPISQSSGLDPFTDLRNLEHFSYFSYGFGNNTPTYRTPGELAAESNTSRPITPPPGFAPLPTHEPIEHGNLPLPFTMPQRPAALDERGNWAPFTQVKSGVQQLCDLLPGDVPIVWKHEGRYYKVTRSLDTGNIAVSVDGTHLTISGLRGSVTLNGKALKESTREQATDMLKSACNGLAQFVRNVPPTLAGAARPVVTVPHAEDLFIGATTSDAMLNPLHPDGASNHDRFAALGFFKDNRLALEFILRQAIMNEPATLYSRTADARFYHVDFPFMRKNGTVVEIRANVALLDQGRNGQPARPFLTGAYVRTHQSASRHRH